MISQQQHKRFGGHEARGAGNRVTEPARHGLHDVLYLTVMPAVTQGRAGFEVCLHGCRMAPRYDQTDLSYTRRQGFMNDILKYGPGTAVAIDEGPARGPILVP